MLAGWCKMHGPFQHPGLSSQKSVILYYCVAQLHFRTFYFEDDLKYIVFHQLLLSYTQCTGNFL